MFRRYLIALLVSSLSVAVAGCGANDQDLHPAVETQAESHAGPTDLDQPAQVPSPGAKEAGEAEAGGDDLGPDRGRGSDRKAGADRRWTPRDSDPPNLDTPPTGAAIKRDIPAARITGEGRVQTLPADPARHRIAQRNMYGSIRQFGQEAEGRNATEITFALLAYLTAKARGDWQRACDRLYGPLRQGVEADGADCAEAFGSMMSRVSAQTRAEEALIDISSVRHGPGDRAFVIYKTPNTLSADMPLYLENGTWKVAALQAYALTPEQLG